MNLLNATVFVYPDAVRFLLFTLCVITFGIWVGIKEDGHK